MHYKAFDKATELLLAIFDKDWGKANVLLVELATVLETYKRSC